MNMEHSWDPITDLLDATGRDRRWLAPALLGAACAHGAIGLEIKKMWVAPAIPQTEAPTQTMDIEVPESSPLPPATTPTPVAAVPPPNERNESGKVAKPSASEPPAGAAAVLTKSADPSDPLDLTADGFVLGSAAEYVGGWTAQKGVGRSAGSRGIATAASALRVASSPGAFAGPDRSRRASVLGSSAWDCPFPVEADADSINSAVVSIRVDVSEIGAVTRAVVVSDPGHGFGREAERCARGKRWDPSLDRDGKPIPGTVTVRVRFDR